MPDTVNPYIPGQPVDNPKLFFGRRDEFTSLLEGLMKGRRVFVVSGPARIGKSSFLRQLPSHLPPAFLPVRIEFMEEDARQLDWLLWRVADAVAQQAGPQLGLDDLKPSWADFEAHTSRLLDSFWPQVDAALGERGLVLLLDDIEILAAQDAKLLDTFLAALARWRERESALSIVLAMQPALQDSLSRKHSRFFGGIMAYLLGPLSGEEATRLVTWPVDGILTYDYGVARRLVELASGHPFYLQLLCFEVFNRCASAGWVNQRDLDLVMEDLVGREIADFRKMWNDSSDQEQAALAALVSLRGARGMATVQETCTLLVKAGARVESAQVADALDSLASRGILERLGALSYRFRVALLRDWLSQRIDLQKTVRETRWGASELERASTQTTRVRKLSTQRERKRKEKVHPTRPEEASQQQGGEDGGEKPRPKLALWPWFAAAATLTLLAVILGPRLLRTAMVEPTPIVTLPPSPTVRLATATLTSTPTAMVQAVSVTSPTTTRTPLPTATPSPTPPMVVSRSVPAIAYQSREQGEDSWFIHVMSNDGKDRTRLAEGQSQFLSPPSWSPDGSQLVFSSDQGGVSDIWIMDIDGSNLTNLTQDEAKDQSPAWSPDGHWIAFASVRDSLYWELYLMRPDGSDVQRLTWWEDASDLAPSWSPDGTRLAFATKRDGNWEIYSMDRDGSNLVRLTTDPGDDTNPAWSPDGSRIAFTSTRDGYAEIYVMPVMGGSPLNVSNAPYSTERGATWSPDGGRIAFYSDRDGGWDIYVMASDGSDVVKLTGSTTNDQVPAWRP